MKEECQNQMSTKETAELFHSNLKIWDSWDIGIRTKQTRIYFSNSISFWNILYWWLLYFRSSPCFIEMALPTSTELKINSTTMSYIPELVGQSNYPIWSTQVCFVLQAYSMFEFIDKTLTHNGLQDTADHNKWKMLDHHMLGLMAGTVNDSLTSHVNFEWADQQNYPSVVKAFGRSY